MTQHTVLPGDVLLLSLTEKLLKKIANNNFEKGTVKEVRKGWQCPLCSRVYSPEILCCPHCSGQNHEELTFSEKDGEIL